MSELVKRKSEISETPVKDAGVNVGDMFIYNNSSSRDVVRILGVDDDGKYVRYTYEDLVDVMSGKFEKATGVYSNTGKEFDQTISKDDMGKYYTKITQAEFDLWISQAKEFLATGELKGFDMEESDGTNETALVVSGSKQYLEVMESGLQAKADQLDGMKFIISLKMQEQENKLRAMKNKLDGVLTIFKKQIEKIQRVITVIELYLGIEEELHQLHDGIAADVQEPITFRQQVLYMDEETKILSGQGIDFKRVSEFDEWLLADENYKKVIPEEKCVVAFHPRRRSIDYGGGSWEDAQKNAKNKWDTYFLIRNGEKLYRIFTDKIVVDRRMFPLRDEMSKMFSDMQKKIAETYSERSKQEAKDKVEDSLYFYKKIAYFYQGLLDRTEVFQPLPERLSIFEMDKFEGRFNFVYDDEIALPNGQMPFWDWHTKINSSIVRGSRVLLTGRYGMSSKDYADRFQRRHSTHKLPQQGLYEVDVRYVETTADLPHYYIEWLESKGLLISKGTELLARYCDGYQTHDHYEYNNIGKDIVANIVTITRNGHKDKYVEAYKCKFQKEELFIRYNPKDEVSAGWGDYDWHVRKNNLSFQVSRHDEFVLNYDLLDTDTIKFYLTSRADRQNYYEMIPLLLSILAERKEEEKWEVGFAKMLVDNAVRKHGDKLDSVKCEKFIWECINWWKNKVIFKRPITKDDTKALSMIESRVLAKVNEKHYVNK